MTLQAYSYEGAIYCADCVADGLKREIVDRPENIKEIELDSFICHDCGAN